MAIDHHSNEEEIANQDILNKTSDKNCIINSYFSPT